MQPLKLLLSRTCYTQIILVLYNSIICDNLFNTILMG